MATPILTQISKDLAYKLQDPVSLGTASGARITADERLRYIIRAYRRLLRIVALFYPELIQKMFQNYYKPQSGTSGVTGQITDAPYVEILSVHCKRSVDADFSKATYVSPDDYNNILSGLNRFYTGDAEQGIYFWTLLNASTVPTVMLLPAQTLDYRIVYRPDTISSIETSGYSGVDIDIPKEFIDLLLSLSASEAYLDIGQVDMYNLYANDVTQQLSIFNAKTQEKDIKDEDKTH